MAEIIGLTASIIGIIEGISKTRAFAKEYLYKSSTLRSELVAMLGKLTAFAGLLQGLKLQAEMDPFNQKRLAVLTHVDGPLLACKAALTSIQSRLDQVICKNGIVVGKLLDKESQAALKIIDDTKPILELALVADQT
jgi:hypothetical protein